MSKSIWLYFDIEKIIYLVLIKEMRIVSWTELELKQVME